MIKFNNFNTEYNFIKSEIDASISRVISSGWYILGIELSNFEKLFSKYLGANYCVGVGSGTDALTISLMSLNIGKGDEVITTSLTAYPTITGILNSGAKPVLVDVYKSNALMDVEKIEAKINKKTKAIMPVHLYGQSCDMNRIKKIAKKHNLTVVEDCAQATGALYKGKKVGTIGDCGAFSFYPTKNLGSYGDGGAIITNSEEIYLKAKLYRNYGQEDKYNHTLNGLNSRLDEVQAAVLATKLKFLDSWNQKRRKIAKKYSTELETVDFLKNDSDSVHVHHLYVVKSNNRDKLMNHLTKNGVEALIHYPLPINKQKAFAKIGNGTYKNADEITKQILSLPINPWLKDDEINSIIEITNLLPNEN